MAQKKPKPIKAMQQATPERGKPVAAFTIVKYETGILELNRITHVDGEAFDVEKIDLDAFLGMLELIKMSRVMGMGMEK